MRCDNTADNMDFKVFFCYPVSVFLPTTLASLPSGVMLLNSAPRDSATDIEKTSWNGAPKRERPNRSIVKIGQFRAYAAKISIQLENEYYQNRKTAQIWKIYDNFLFLAQILGEIILNFLKFTVFPIYVNSYL